MKEVTMYLPEQDDKDIAHLLQYLDNMDEVEMKSIKMVLTSGQYLNAVQWGYWLIAVSKGIQKYASYVKQDIQIGGLIATEEAAQGMKQNWCFIGEKLRIYLAQYQRKYHEEKEDQ